MSKTLEQLAIERAKLLEEIDILSDVTPDPTPASGILCVTETDPNDAKVTSLMLQRAKLLKEIEKLEDVTPDSTPTSGVICINPITSDTSKICS